MSKNKQSKGDNDKYVHMKKNVDKFFNLHQFFQQKLHQIYRNFIAIKSKEKQILHTRPYRQGSTWSIRKAWVDSA